MANYSFDKDYSEDWWRWSKLYDLIKDQHNNNALDQLQADIIKNKDAALAFFFAFYVDYKTHLMQKVIIDAANHKYSYAFAATITGADIKTLQHIVIASKNIKYICNFGCFVKGSDKKKIEGLIIKSNKPKQTHQWLKYGKIYNFNKIKNIILNAKTAKPKFIFELASRLVYKRDIRKAEKLIIESGSCVYIRLFAQKIIGANIRKLERAILETGNIAEIKKFAKSVKGSKIAAFAIMI